MVSDYMGVKMRIFGCHEATLITMKLCGAIASEYMGGEIRSSKVGPLSSVPNQPRFYTVLNIYPEYMYDMPLSSEPCS